MLLLALTNRSYQHNGNLIVYLLNIFITNAILYLFLSFMMMYQHHWALPEKSLGNPKHYDTNDEFHHEDMKL
jgi:Na+/H+ antiporter NhaC